MIPNLLYHIYNNSSIYIDYETLVNNPETKFPFSGFQASANYDFDDKFGGIDYTLPFKSLLTGFKFIRTDNESELSIFKPIKTNRKGNNKENKFIIKTKLGNIGYSKKEDVNQ